MILETERLRLEPLAPEHAAALRAIWSDPEVARFLISRPASPAEFDALFARNLEAGRRSGMWAVRDRASGSVVGRVGFFAFGEEERPELAFLLARASGGGASRGKRRAPRWAAASARSASPRSWLSCAPPTPAPCACLASLGFEAESRLLLADEPADLQRVDAGRFAAAAEPSPPRRVR